MRMLDIWLKPDSCPPAWPARSLQTELLARIGTRVQDPGHTQSPHVPGSFGVALGAPSPRPGSWGVSGSGSMAGVRALREAQSPDLNVKHFNELGAGGHRREARPLKRSPDPSSEDPL